MLETRKTGLAALGVALALVVFLTARARRESEPSKSSDDAGAALSAPPIEIAPSEPPETTRSTEPVSNQRIPLQIEAGRILAGTQPAGTLVIRVVAKGSGEPVEGVRVIVHGRLKDQDAHEGELESTTDQRGTVVYRVPARRRLRVSAWSSDVRFGGRTQPASPLEPGEVRELVMSIPAEDLRFFGRVLDRESGRPLEGARIMVLPAQNRSLVVSTNEGGMFELAVAKPRPRDELWLWIEAQGHAPVTGTLVSGHDKPERAHLFRLEGAASLEGRVLDGSGEPLSGHEIEVSVQARQFENPLVGQRLVEALQAKTDQLGRYGFAGLPVRTELAVEVARGGGLPPEVRRVVLAPREARRLDFTIAPAVRLEGLVLDSTGIPVPLLELAVDRGTVPGCLSPFTEFVGTITTDEAGRFRTRRGLAGIWRIGPSPAQRRFAPWGEVIEVNPSPPSQFLTLTLQPALHVWGRVEDAQGLPAGGARVTLRSEHDDLVLEAHCDDQGAFACGPLPEGEFFVEAFSRGAKTGSGQTRARAGDSNLVLRLSPLAGSIRGEIRGLRSLARQVLVRAFPSDGGRPLECWSHNRGKFDFGAMPPERYDLVASDGLGGWGRAVGVSPSLNRSALVRIELEPMTTLRVTNVSESELEVRAQLGDFPVGLERIAPGTDRVLDVPPGALTLLVTPRVPGAATIAYPVQAVLNDEASIELR